MQSQRNESTSSKNSNTKEEQKSVKKKPGVAISSRMTNRSLQNKNKREEQICDKISEIFKERQKLMSSIIVQTIYDDRRVYKQYRREFDAQISELEKERVKIQKRKKNKKEKAKLLKANTIQKLTIFCAVLKQTYIHYQKLYFENDHYRHLKLIEVQTQERNELMPKKQKTVLPKIEDKQVEVVEEQKQPEEIVSPSPEVIPPQVVNIPLSFSGPKFIKQLLSFFESPFKDDRKFALSYMATLTRDRVHESEEVINKLFYKQAFTVLMGPKGQEDINRHKAFEILCNMVASDKQRHKLASEEYFFRVYEKYQYVIESKNTDDERILEKLSWLSCLIAFHQDMFDHIIKINLLTFVIKISGKNYKSSIRSNAVLAISLLTYNENLFDEIINKGVIDLVMALCRDKTQDTIVKQYSTLALVHFALNRKSIKILIDKGVLGLFDAFSGNVEDTNSMIIQTNVAWIFLALCNNDITGKQMLEKGITRDMFLVSCNPNYQQIRHLVITGFAELGRCTDNNQQQKDLLDQDQQRIKEKAIVGMHSHLEKDAQLNVDILINFSCSDNVNYQYTAFWALKDYILLTHENLIPDIKNVIQAFVNGCLQDVERIQAQCANAISFLVTHLLVYKSIDRTNLDAAQFKKIVTDIQKSKVEYILDSIMYLSGNDSKFIRTTAFSTLSSLSKFSSQCDGVKAQITRDIQLPDDLTSKDYLQFLYQRMNAQKEIFYQEFKNSEIEKQFSGLYSLLRLAQEPFDVEIEEVSDNYIEFIKMPYDTTQVNHIMNEEYFVKVFLALKHTRNPKIISKLLQVIKFYIDQDDSKFQKQIISPHTILWMLEIMEHQKNEKYLCCLTAKTLLSIVSKHQIEFDYQEVAIIKKFNLALQNIEVFDSDDDDDEQIEQSTNRNEMTTKQNSVAIDDNEQFQDDNLDAITPISITNEKFKIQSDFVIEDNQEIQLDQRKISASQLSLKQIENDGQVQENEILQIEQRQSSFKNPNSNIDLQEQQQNQGNDFQFQDFREVNSSANSKTKNKVPLQNEELEQEFAKQNSNEIVNTDNVSSPDKQDQIIKIEQQRQGSKSVILQDNTVKDQSNVLQYQNQQGFNVSQSNAVIFARKTSRKVTLFKKSISTFKNSQIKNSYNTTIQDLKSGENNMQDLDQLENESKNENLNFEDIDPNDFDTIDMVLRDSLIKSFMVIFTNDKSQHLLLNKDLIDIAFNCLELCTECSLEAKRHVARLISIIFKFPQVQERVMSEKVVQGVCVLLRMVKEINVVRDTIKACTYISMNYDFVKQSQFSLIVLQALMMLLDKMETGQDQFNIILTIKNILKGDKINKIYFYENGGTQKFMDFIIETKDINFIEMCTSGISEQFQLKKIVKKIIEDEVSVEKLKIITQKCLKLSEFWYKNLNDKIEDEKIQIQLNQEDEGRNGNNSALTRITHESKYSYSNNESNIQIPDFMKNDIQKLNSSTNQIQVQQLKVSKQGKIRNSMYYIIARALKFGMETTFLIQECEITDKVMKDMDLQNINQFIFQNILLLIGNLKMNIEAIIKLLNSQIDKIINQIHELNESERKLSLLRVILILILEVSEHISSNQYIFSKILNVANDARTTDRMKENILWMVSQIFEQNHSDQSLINLQRIMIKNDILGLIQEGLKSQEERNILQALLLIAQISVSDEFRYELLRNNSTMKQLQIISSSFEQFTIYNIEIQTAICKCIDQITQVEDLSEENYQNENIDIKLRNQIQVLQLEQIKFFQKFIIHSILSKEYKVTRIDDDKDEVYGDEEEVTRKLSNIDQNLLIIDDDDIEKVEEHNQMIESLVFSIANITNDSRTHYELLQNGLIDIFKKFLKIIMQQAYVENQFGIDETNEGIELSVMPMGTVNLIKSISTSILNISQVPSIQRMAINLGILDVITSYINNIHDYEVHSKIYQAIGNFLISGLGEKDALEIQRNFQLGQFCSSIRDDAKKAGFLEKINFAYEYSPFFKIKRICGEYLSVIYDKQN